MSRYIGYVLERSGAPQPHTAVIWQHKCEWVNQQIYSELKFVFPSLEVTVEASIPVDGKPDLVVLPYVSSLRSEYSLYSPSFRMPSKAEGLWVMIYGVNRRVIYVMPSRRLMAFVLYRGAIQALRFVLRKTGLVHTTGRLCSRAVG